MDVKNTTTSVDFDDKKMRKVNLFESPRFFCDLYCLRPGQEQKVHSHAENDKVYYILRGEGKVIVGDEERSLSEGEIVVARAGEPHGIKNETDVDLVCLVFMAPHPSLK